MVVTDTGAPVWVRRAEEGDAVLTAGTDGKLAELDRGPAGATADLRAAGDRATWTNGGARREAVP